MNRHWNSYLNKALSRRELLQVSSAGFGSLALAGMLGQEQLRAAAPSPLSVKPPQFPAKAKRVIFLFMHGGPSQVDTFDYKPLLKRDHGKPLPFQARKVVSSETFNLLQSPWAFKQYGQSGAWVSDLFPETAKMVDDMCFVKSMWGTNSRHGGALLELHTGSDTFVRPSMGSWITYGLGSENNDLPAFVVLTPKFSPKVAAQALFTRMWSSGFLPTKFSGVALRAQGDPVLYLDNPAGVDAATRRAMLDSLAQFNQLAHAKHGDPETLTRIAQYEMAFRMQTSVPELTDFSNESAATLDLYGPAVKEPGSFAASCLLARRLAERNVRVVQILHRGWDQHGTLPEHLKIQCNDTDRGCYALIADLKQRGLLDDTLVIWAGEFGRTVYSQGTLTRTNYGRDHHPRCFTVWLAGGGVKGGMVYGETDDFSYNIARDPVSLFDLNATMLHCLGIDHRRFSYKFQGLDARLSGVEPANVLQDILA